MFSFLLFASEHSNGDIEITRGVNAEPLSESGDRNYRSPRDQPRIVYGSYSFGQPRRVVQSA